ncbi:prepilin-type N-terminal cleavage/methylation domain-containing protein [Oxalobacteraceae bacterium OM1]|nr:prepilin-type N-terminal cleavage/methylation domain-containing protein [Oxalobacteraceae bacterium OM1]
MRARGFSMIELMVALAILATILSLAAPRYFNNLDVAKESVLREDLYVMRDALDKYFSDNGKYPATLDDLVTKRYLRAIPVDPFTQSAKSWVLVAPADPSLGAVFDVRSSAPNKARDGTWYKDW